MFRQWVGIRHASYYDGGLQVRTAGRMAPVFAGDLFLFLWVDADCESGKGNIAR